MLNSFKILPSSEGERGIYENHKHLTLIQALLRLRVSEDAWRSAGAGLELVINCILFPLRTDRSTLVFHPWTISTSASMKQPVRLQEIFIKRRLIVNRYSMSPAYELSGYKDVNVCSTRARREQTAACALCPADDSSLCHLPPALCPRP